jgi:glycosyltransferase involved in cell wall biosynthesis
VGTVTLSMQSNGTLSAAVLNGAKPWKVVHLTSVHSPLDHRILHKECRSLARAGFDVTIIGPHSADTEKDQVHIKSIQARGSRVERMTRTAWRIYQEAQQQHADIYHFHDPELIPIGLLLRASGKRVIYDIHEDVPREILSKYYLPFWSRKAVAWIVERVETTACGFFSALVTTTPTIARRFHAINRRTVIVRNYPYPDEIISAQPAGDWNARRQSVAYVGGVTAERGVREMVAAMSLLPESLDGTLELVGNEVPAFLDPPTLYAHPGWKRVWHHGILEQSKVFRVLHNVRAGLAVLHPIPNFLDAIPVKFFEYMGAGIPIIASDFPAWRQILDESGCALFVNPMKPQAIAEAIQYILTHPAQAEEMGRRGREAMVQKFDWKTEATTLVNLYSGFQEPLCAA